jgi:hypothetical protein
VPDFETFAASAKNLSRNPLGIIALFIVLIYGFAALTLGLNSGLQPAERAPLIWFLVVFPVFVLVVFGWLVSKHHDKLYAPSDYKSDEGFLHGVRIRARHTAEVQEQQEHLKSVILKTVSSAPSTGATSEEFDALLEQLSKDVDDATTFTVDASEFLKKEDERYTFPVAAFETFNDLTNAVYFNICDRVEPFAYGYSWVLRDAKTGRVVEHARMLSRAGPGQPIPDTRSLKEVGIAPGTHLKVSSPRHLGTGHAPRGRDGTPKL